MSRRDFASLRAPADPSTPRAWLPVAGVVLVAALSFAGGYLVAGLRAPQPDGTDERLEAEIARLKGELAAGRRVERALRERLAAIRERAPELGEFTFYHDLPAAPVEPTPLPSPGAASGGAAATGSAPPARAEAEDPLAGIIRREIGRPAAARHAWRVQAGSFRTRREAEALRRRLIDAGIEARVRDVSLAERGRWFRVYTVAVGSRKDAERLRRGMLERLGIHGMIVKSDDADG